MKNSFYSAASGQKPRGERIKPRILETKPNEPEAEQIYKYWFKTFQCFLTSAEATRRNADNEPQLNKLALLFNYVSHRIYLYIKDSTTYEDAKQVLDLIYLKPKNEIFFRHLLMITKQKNNESFVNLLEHLKNDQMIAIFKQLQPNNTETN